MQYVIRLFLLLSSFIFIAAVAAAQNDAETNRDAKLNNGKSKSSINKSKTAKLAAAVAKPQSKNAGNDEAAKAQAAFDELKNTVEWTERIPKLNKFIQDFPRSDLKIKAVEMLIVSRVEAGEAGFESGDSSGGAAQFRRAAEVFESGVGDGIFNDLIAKLPFNLFYRGEQTAALEVAQIIEPKIAGNAPRLLTLANFYLSIENPEAAKIVATRAAEAAPDSIAAQLSLGMAHRIAFHLEAASQAYARALQLDPASLVAKRSLADAWRGLGQTDDALRLYRELLAADAAADEAAQNGLVLTLFNAGNKEEAEKQLAAALAQNPKNLLLQTGAAYWYAANGDGKRAVELAQKAVEIEPRYVWGQIALARGLILENRPLDAERALLTARRFGKFPTLDYELASAHFAAGLYDEAADDLRRSFALKNGNLETKLAGREIATAENFTELLSRERRASIFQPASAGSDVEARKLKELLALTDHLRENLGDHAAENVDENGLVRAAQDFAADDDPMRVHRELYAADKLLNRKVALAQVLELTQNATGGLEKALDVPAATAAVLADELYEPRRLALTTGNIVNIPALPRETLRQIMRGRVEEISGWALYRQNKPEEATVRLRRAVSVLPENSAWWRSSYWRLGSALEAAGKPKEALDAYLKSYQADTPNEARLVIIQALYQRVNGSLDGLERRLSQTETPAAAASLPVAQKQTLSLLKPVSPLSTTSAPFKNPLPNVIGEIVQPKPSETPKQIEAPKAETPSSVAETKVEPALVAPPEAKPEFKNETAALQSEPPPEAKSTPENPVTAPTPEVKLESQAKPESETPPTPIRDIKLEQTAITATPEKAEDAKSEKVEKSAEEDKSADKTMPAEPMSVPLSETNPIRAGDAKTVLPPETKTAAPVAAEPPSLPPDQKASGDNGAPNTSDVQNKVDNKTVALVPPTIASGEGAVKNEVLAADSAFLRPRVIIVPLNEPPSAIVNEKNENAAQSSVCAMRINQPEISILRNGGTLAFLVEFDNATDAKNLKVTPSSHNDLSVILLPNDAADETHRLIQVSSISEITRIFTLTLELPCGKKEISIKVR